MNYEPAVASGGNSLKTADTRMMPFGYFSAFGGDPCDEYCQYYTIEDLLAIAKRALGDEATHKWDAGIDGPEAQVNRSKSLGILNWLQSKFAGR